MRPRRWLIEPFAAPMYCSGTTTSTSIIGSSSCGFALRNACLKHCIAQVMNANSFESTSW